MLFFSRVPIDRSPAACRSWYCASRVTGRAVVHMARGPQRGPHGARAATATEVTQMQDDKFSVGLVSGVPVVTAPQEIDITNAPDLRSALLQAAADAWDVRGRHGPDPVLRFVRLNALLAAQNLPRPKAASCCSSFAVQRSYASSRSPPSTA